MAHLRLVAGTAVTGAGRENFETPLEEAIKVARVSVPQMQEQARAVIRGLRPGLDSLTVAELLAEVDGNLAGRVHHSVAIPRNSRIRWALEGIGIHLNSALPEQDLDVNCYGLVVDTKKLLKTCPALKPCVTVLEGLTL